MIKKRKKQSLERKKSNYVDNAKLLAEVLRYQQLIKDADGGFVKVTDELATFFMIMAKNLSSKGNFISYCVDSETEALTQRGWLKYDQITTADIILSMNVETKQLTWSPIRELFVNKEYDGLMFKLKGQTLDALVTPGHKFVTERGLISIDKITAKDHFITMGSPTDEVVDKTYSDAFVEIVGWFVTEGTSQKYDRVRDGITSEYLILCQKRGTETHNRITNTFKQLDEEFKTSCWKEYDKDQHGVGYFRLYEPLTKEVLKVSRGRVLSTDFILRLTQDQRVLLIKTMMDADGSGTQYTQKDYEHVKSFLMLCTLAGVTTHTTKRIWETPFGLADMYIITLCNSKQCYSECVDFHGGRRGPGGDVYIKSNTPTVPYKGIVWCPRTDFGTFVCKRGTRIYVTGNTWKDEMISDGLEDCIRSAHKFNATKGLNAFTYFSTIMFWAFVRRIKKENKQVYCKYKSFLTSPLMNEDEILTMFQTHDSLKENKLQFVQNFEDTLVKTRAANKKKREDKLSEKHN